MDTFLRPIRVRQFKVPYTGELDTEHIRAWWRTILENNWDDPGSIWQISSYPWRRSVHIDTGRLLPIGNNSHQTAETLTRKPDNAVATCSDVSTVIKCQLELIPVPPNLPPTKEKQVTVRHRKGE